MEMQENKRKNEILQNMLSDSVNCMHLLENENRKLENLDYNYKNISENGPLFKRFKKSNEMRKRIFWHRTFKSR